MHQNPSNLILLSLAILLLELSKLICFVSVSILRDPSFPAHVRYGFVYFSTS